MKKLLFIAVILIPLLSGTQNKILDREFFDFSNKGLKPNVVTVYNVSLSKEELYARAMLWIDAANTSIDGCTIKLVSKETNQRITIRGQLSYYLCEITKALKFRCFNTRFTMELLFIDGGYSIQPISLKYEANNNTLWLPIKLDKKSKTIYKSDGTVRPSFISFPSTIKTLFNALDISLYSYLINNEILKIQMY